jgi:hypothetical protein
MGIEITRVQVQCEACFREPERRASGFAAHMDTRAHSDEDSTLFAAPRRSKPAPILLPADGAPEEGCAESTSEHFNA